MLFASEQFVMVGSGAVSAAAGATLDAAAAGLAAPTRALATLTCVWILALATVLDELTYTVGAPEEIATADGPGLVGLPAEPCC